jgi:alpha-glucosidase
VTAAGNPAGPSHQGPSRQGPSHQGQAGRWWQGAVLYQVYIRSFADTNGDGYGDLPGVTERLDHLAWLGVDGLWLSPSMPSPDDDWGYDVSDYRSVHPGLGTLADLDRLVAEAGRRGIKVLLDLVPNHTSSAHPWFVEAARGRDAGKRDYYVWADPAPGGGPPNNWLSVTGDCAWTFDQPSGQYYLHNFLPSQPDLNWWNPAVHREFEDILRFWFDRGVAGFRIDVAHGLYKDAELRDNPPAQPGSHPMLRGELDQKYNANRPEVHQVYRDWRGLARAYQPPRLLLGETWVFPVGAMLSYYGADDELQLAFNFPFLFTEFSAPQLAGVVRETFAGLPAGGCPVWTASNHDVSRLGTRWCGGDERRIRLALLILTTLPGTTTLYYGDEIGMTDVDIPPGEQRDAMTRGQNQRTQRDRARTPMQWSAAEGAGFTPPGVKPWLPFGDYRSVNVADQRGDPGSVLTLVRDLIALRHTRQSGRVAEFAELAVADDYWAYRSGDLVVAVNLSDETAEMPLTAGEVLRTTGAPPDSYPAGQPLRLGAWEGVVMQAAG